MAQQQVPEEEEQARRLAVRNFLAARRQASALKREHDEALAEAAAMLEWASGASAPLEMIKTVRVPIGSWQMELQLAQTSSCGVGGVVWPSTTALCRWLAKEALRGRHEGRKKVVELGCGCAAVASLCSTVYGLSVVATDIATVTQSVELQKNMENNYETVARYRQRWENSVRYRNLDEQLNRQPAGAVVATSGSHVQVSELDWQQFAASARTGGDDLDEALTADLVLAGDVLYSSDESVLSSLAETIAYLLRGNETSGESPGKSSEEALPSSQLRANRCAVIAFPTRRAAVEDRFLSVLCPLAGLVVTERYCEEAFAGDQDNQGCHIPSDQETLRDLEAPKSPLQQPPLRNRHAADAASKRINVAVLVANVEIQGSVKEGRKDKPTGVKSDRSESGNHRNRVTTKEEPQTVGVAADEQGLFL